MAAAALESSVASLQEGLAKIHHADDEYEKASHARVLRLETMDKVRAVCDKAEEDCPADLWTIATYKELLFLDTNQGAEILDIE